MAIICLNDQHGCGWASYHGDCVDVLRQLPGESVGFSIYSPPFSNLFIYSDSDGDRCLSRSMDHHQRLMSIQLSDSHS